MDVFNDRPNVNLSALIGEKRNQTFQKNNLNPQVTQEGIVHFIVTDDVALVFINSDEIMMPNPIDLNLNGSLLFRRVVDMINQRTKTLEGGTTHGRR